MKIYRKHKFKEGYWLFLVFCGICILSVIIAVIIFKTNEFDYGYINPDFAKSFDEMYDALFLRKYSHYREFAPEIILN